MFVNECYAPNADEVGRRFTLAHEFCHLLFDQDQGQALAVASGPWAPRAIEQRANAFAAMFLMPAFLLKQMLSGLTVPITMKGDVDDLAKHPTRRPITLAASSGELGIHGLRGPDSSGRRVAALCLSCTVEGKNRLRLGTRPTAAMRIRDVICDPWRGSPPICTTKNRIAFHDDGRAAATRRACRLRKATGSSLKRSEM